MAEWQNKSESSIERVERKKKLFSVVAAAIVVIVLSIFCTPKVIVFHCAECGDAEMKGEKKNSKRKMMQFMEKERLRDMAMASTLPIYCGYADRGSRVARSE